MAQRVRKAVLPVAGLGTRFLPATKAVPKELLTVVDRPLIQYAVEECLAAGIDEFVFVTGRNKGAIEDHFDLSYELEDTLAQRGNKAAELQQTQAATLKQGNAIFTRQQKPLGLGHAVWCARHWIGNEPFAVLLPDELTLGTPNCTARLVEAHGHTGGSVVAVMDVPREHTNRYGIAAVEKEKNGLSEITGMVEKPKPQDGAVHSCLDRPLCADAGSVRISRQERSRCRWGNPAYRCHGQDDRHLALPCAAL